MCAVSWWAESTIERSAGASVFARRMTSKPSGSPGWESSSRIRSCGCERSIAARASPEDDVLSTTLAPIRSRTISIASSQIG